MDCIAVELIQIIFSYACADDHGKTARTLGLVSKGFREIAAPLEFRSLLIAGPRQLSRLMMRLGVPDDTSSIETNNSYERAFHFDSMITKQIRHILISDVSIAHSLASDSTCAPYTSFWSTSEGQQASREYADCSESFRSCVKTLLRCTSSTLQSLSILAYSSPIIHSTLSGLDFPRLRYLTVKSRSSRIQSDYFSANASIFVHPTAPNLRRLHFDGPSWVQEYRGMKMCYTFLNPFLKGVSSRYPDLNHLVISDHNLSDVGTLIKVLHGLTSSESLHCNTAGGRVKAFVFEKGASPKHEAEFGFQELIKQREALTSSVEKLPVHFLEVRVPVTAPPNEGKTCFEGLLSEWENKIID